MPSFPLLKYWLTDRLCLYPSQYMNMKTSKVFPAEKKRRGGCKALITIVACLYALLALSLGQVALAVYLLASKTVEPTTFIAEIMVIIAGALSTVEIILYTALSRRCRRANSYRSRRGALSSTCCLLPRLMIVAWMAAAGVGLVFAARQPTCLGYGSQAQSWQLGSPCIVQRVGVVASLTALVVSSVLFAAIELCDRPFAASLAGIRRANYENEHEHLSMSDSQPSLTRSVSTFSGISSSDDFGTPWNQIPLRSPTIPNFNYLPPLNFQDHQWDKTFRVPFPTLAPAFPSMMTSSSFYSSFTTSSGSSPRTSSQPPFRTIRTVNLPEAPSIPVKYRDEWPSSFAPPPHRPMSKPLLPPPEFWTDIAERSSDGYHVPRISNGKLDTSLPSVSRDVEPQSFHYPMLPYPDNALVAVKNKADPQVRIRSSDKENWGRSYESLRKGLHDDEMAAMGLPWDYKRGGANELTVEEVDRKRKGRGRAVQRKKSRTLVKLRQPSDRKARES